MRGDENDIQKSIQYNCGVVNEGMMMVTQEELAKFLIESVNNRFVSNIF
jgi:hypothetical protein